MVDKHDVTFTLASGAKCDFTVTAETLGRIRGERPGTNETITFHDAEGRIHKVNFMTVAIVSTRLYTDAV